MPKRKILSKNKVKRNTTGLIPFVKGDPRINRNGRPKSFDALRALVQEIGAENIDANLTRIAAKIRLMYTNKQDTATLLAYGWGKPKDEVEVSGELKTPTNVIMLTDVEDDAPND